jgi:acyl-CoA synthetase (NDP forming)
VRADAARVAHAIRDAAAGSSKPVLATFFGAAGADDAAAPIPCYMFPESAVRAFGHAVAYARWRREPPGAVPVFPDVMPNVARAIVDRVAGAGGGWLSPSDCTSLLNAYGIPMVPTHIVASADAAVAAARQLGFPVALKGCGAHIVHKTEAHAVFTGIDDEAGLRQAFDRLMRQPEVTEAVVQPMVTDAIEMIVGGLRHDRFGPVVVCGSGGILVELVHDTVCRLTPLTERDAEQMLNETRGIRLLRGFRGAPSRDEAALRSILLRVSALLDACEAIMGLDLNPVMATPFGALVVDARVRIRGRTRS